ncbi:hypothetical protein OAT18_01490 [Tenacibaculum sp.]|nr:hypothetical protein [Tenacibaculum sp.]
MTNIQNIRTFDDLSEKYATWIIKYCSSTINKSIFMVWYRDNNDTEHILSYKNGGFFISETLTELKVKLKSEKNQLTESENRNLWLDNINEIKLIESCTYDMVSVINNLRNNILNIKTIEGFASFINLFDDFINQDEKNNHLQVYIDDQLIKKTWNYYYESIFWPRFNNREKFKFLNQPKLEINKEKLLSKFQDIILKFESNMKKIENKEL